MARRQRYRPVTRIRRIILAVLVLVVGGLVGLFLFGRQGLEQELETTRSQGMAGGSNVTAEGEGFDFTLVQEDTPIFRIRGQHTQWEGENKVFLERVLMSFFREEGEYVIESDTARYDQETQDTRLEGDVQLTGPDGLEVETDWLRLGNGGQTLVSSAGTRFRSPGRWSGQAESLRIDFAQNAFILEGGVTIESVPAAEIPFVLETRRLQYRKDRRLLRADGGVDVKRGRERLRARRISLFLAEETDEIRFLRALWEVEGQFYGVSNDSKLDRAGPVLDFQGTSLALLIHPDTGQAEKMDLEGTHRQQAHLELRGEVDGAQRSLEAVFISGEFSESGLLMSADALGPVTLAERVPLEDGSTLERHISAARGQARFGPAGELAGMTLEEDVRLREGEVEVKGEKAFLDLERGHSEMFGEPVDVRHPRGRMTAPHVVWTRSRGLIHAQEGVRTVLEPDRGGRLAGLPFSGEEAVRIDSDEAFLQESPSSVLFKGGVRAWQGKNLLLARELRGEEDQSRMSASGGIKTVYYPTPPAPSSQEDEETSGAETSEEKSAFVRRNQPIEVTADIVSYEDSAHTLSYHGNVQALQANRALSCTDMEIELDELHRAKTLTCDGETKLVDPEMGWTIEGDRAVYDLSSDVIEVFGAPQLVALDREGRWMKGHHLIYSFTNGTVEVGSGEEKTVRQPSG